MLYIKRIINITFLIFLVALISGCAGNLGKPSPNEILLQMMEQKTLERTMKVLSDKEDKQMCPVPASNREKELSCDELRSQLLQKCEANQKVVNVPSVPSINDLFASDWD